MENYEMKHTTLNKKYSNSLISKSRLEKDQILLIKNLVDSNIFNTYVKFPSKININLPNQTYNKISNLVSFFIPVRIMLKKIRKKKSINNKSKPSKVVMNLLQFKNYFNVYIANTEINEKFKNPISIRNTTLISIFEYANISLSKLFDKIIFSDYFKEYETNHYDIPKILSNFYDFRVKICNMNISISNKSLINIFYFNNKFDSFITKVFIPQVNEKKDLFISAKNSICLNNSNNDDIFFFNEGVKAKNIIQSPHESFLFSILKIEKKVVNMEAEEIRNAKEAFSSLLDTIMKSISSKKLIRRIFIDWKIIAKNMKDDEHKEINSKYKSFSMKNNYYEDEFEENEDEESEEQEYALKISDNKLSDMDFNIVENNLLPLDLQSISVLQQPELTNDYNMDFFENNNQDNKDEYLLFENLDDITKINKDMNHNENVNNSSVRIIKVMNNLNIEQGKMIDSSQIEQNNNIKSLGIEASIDNDQANNDEETYLLLKDNNKTKDCLTSDNNNLGENYLISKIVFISLLLIIGLALMILGFKQELQIRRLTICLIAGILISLGVISSIYIYIKSKNKL